MGNKVVIIYNSNELVRVRPERIVYIISDGNYSTMVLHDKMDHVFTMNLSHCQEMLEKQLGSDAETFIRIGKQLIINRSFLFYVPFKRYEMKLCLKNPQPLMKSLGVPLYTMVLKDEGFM